MCAANKLGVSLLLCFLVYYVECERFSAAREYKVQEKDRKSKQHDNVEFPYKLENAPIPAIHDGPKALRLYSKTDALELLHDRIRRHITSSSSPNPQRPNEEHEIAHEEISESSRNNDGYKHFHHPGHQSEPSRNYPVTGYNYYNTIKTYGSAFRYGNNQPFKGYVQTANIGVIPPKDVDAKDYYNSISGLNDYPLMKQHSNRLLESLYGNRQYPGYGYGYGYGNRDSAKNAYRNVLTGLAMWSIKNGLINSKRYAVYNYTTLPPDYPSDVTLSNDTIVPCFEDTTALCNEHTQPLCINNGTTFCVSSAIIPCRDVALGNTCVDISIPCNGCEDTQPTHLPCATNITVSTVAEDDEKVDLLGNPSPRHVVLCATTLVVPQLKNVGCDNLPCLENTTENSIGSAIENTTNSSNGKK